MVRANYQGEVFLLADARCARMVGPCTTEEDLRNQILANPSPGFEHGISALMGQRATVGYTICRGRTLIENGTVRYSKREEKYSLNPSKKS